MTPLFILVVWGLLITISSTNGLKCPFESTQKSVNRFEHECWDGSNAAGVGCCRTERCLRALIGLHCACPTACKGWSVDLVSEPNHHFPESDHDTDTDIVSSQGSDDACRSFPIRSFKSVRVNGNTCVKLWQGNGCTGKHVAVTGETISDINIKGFSEIHGVSGCNFTVPKPVEVTIYQHNFWSLFGSKETITVNPGMCTNMQEWWKDRISMTQAKRFNCYKIWALDDCHGPSRCDCGPYSLELNAKTIDGVTRWNNRVRSMSLCSYPE